MGKVVAPSPFNSPLELGIRMVYLLSALYPRHADLQKLVLMDYAVVYSGDLDGPVSLHTPVPFRGNELYSRRELIESGLHAMSMKGLVGMSLGEDGVTYFAGERARTLIDSVGSTYANELLDRCAWAADRFGSVDSVALSAEFNELGHRWGAELESQSIGVGSA